MHTVIFNNYPDKGGSTSHLCTTTQDFIDHIIDVDHIDILFLGYHLADGSNILTGLNHMVDLVNSGKLTVDLVAFSDPDVKLQEIIARILKQNNINYLTRSEPDLIKKDA